MVGYKIRYGEYGHDCWGASEWFGWYDLNDTIYITHEMAKEAYFNAKQEFPNRDFEIYEVKIV